MADESCEYYKSVNNSSEKKYCTVTCRCVGRSPGDSGELIDYFACISDNHKECVYFLEENKFRK